MRKNRYATACLKRKVLPEKRVCWEIGSFEVILLLHFVGTSKIPNGFVQKMKIAHQAKKKEGKKILLQSTFCAFFKNEERLRKKKILGLITLPRSIKELAKVFIKVEKVVVQTSICPM